MSDSSSRQSQALRELRRRAVLGGGEKRIEQQHARGKLTARGSCNASRGRRTSRTAC